MDNIIQAATLYSRKEWTI